MPWDAAELKIAEVADDGRLHRALTLLGGHGDPVAQAEWAVDGTLLAACERTGWWNLHRVDPETGAAQILHRAEEEFAGAQVTALAKWERSSSSAGLANVLQPVLVVNGDDDTMIPTISSFNLAGQLPDAELSIYPGSGHGALFQHHELFVRQVLDFLRD